MQRLSRIASSEGITLHGADCDISGITADSREVKPNYLFIAIPGTKHDGTAFIAEAVSRGAVAVLAPEGNEKPLPPWGKGLGVGGQHEQVSPDQTDPPPNLPPRGEELHRPTFLTAPDIRRAVSAIAARFYPRQPETIAAVTGTSGKTSVAQFTREIWQAKGRQSASPNSIISQISDSFVVFASTFCSCVRGNAT